MNDKKRRLPRHVDGRIMIYKMPLKSFAFFLPLAILIILCTVFLIRKFSSPVFIMLGTVILGLVGLTFSEFNQRETGLDIIKDMIKYNIEGDKFFERSCEYVPISKRCIRNKIKK